jgi:dienelactone hydrolase
MHTETLDYTADGLHMLGHLALDADATGRRPGVLVFPEAFGLASHAMARAEQLAELGYVALAADLHGERFVAPSLDEALRMIAPLRENPALIRARAQGALDALLTRPEVDPTRIAAIGFCLGGTMALELGRAGAALSAIVGFHSGLATKAPQDAKNIKGRVLMCIGADDPSIDAGQRAAFEAEMREGQVNWQLSVYGKVVHSFTNKEAGKVGNPKFAAYDAQADARSWAEMRMVFDEVFAAA